MSPLKIAVAALVASAPLPAFAQGVSITTQALGEQRQAMPDGTTRITLVPAARMTPGDRVVYQLRYRNNAAGPASGLVIANPIPADLRYAGPAENSPAPELSVDGTRFGALAELQVRDPNGSARPATMADVKVVRWRLANPVAPGGSGQVAFRAVLK
jgi:hypothetical protein